MKFRNFLWFGLMFVFLFSCENNAKKFALKLAKNPEKFQWGDTLKASVRNHSGQKIDSVVYFYGKNRLRKTTGNQPLSVVLNRQPLGKHILSAQIHSEGETTTLKTGLTLLYNKKPVLYTYQVINTFPHDQYAYTQGLDFYRDTLYESTGKRGASSLRKLNYQTGEILKKFTLPTRYFGEGIAVLNGKIYMLTWQSGKGFVYDVNTFERLKTFQYNQSEEGWGLTTDGEKLYKSDGTEKIWILDPETLQEKSFIQTVTHHGITTKLNELEWVEGKIYANTYLKDGVAIIDPQTGAIEGLIDFRGLREKVTRHPGLDVLNGIAYNPNTKKLYVTGKNWDKLFEVKIIKK